MSEKRLLRSTLLNRLEALSEQRRREASRAALAFLANQSGNLLSFSSLSYEIDLAPLNERLAKEKRLFLPKMEGDTLAIYRVIDVPRGTWLHRWGMREPLPEICERVLPSTIDLVLVPGIGFDADHHRLGHGKGFYDRFFASFPSLKKWGIGFAEQKLAALPVEKHDLPLDALHFF